MYLILPSRPPLKIPLLKPFVVFFIFVFQFPWWQYMRWYEDNYWNHRTKKTRLQSRFLYIRGHEWRNRRWIRTTGQKESIWDTAWYAWWSQNSNVRAAVTTICAIFVVAATATATATTAAAADDDDDEDEDDYVNEYDLPSTANLNLLLLFILLLIILPDNEFKIIPIDNRTEAIWWWW